jgi:hypothetical protein
MDGVRYDHQFCDFMDAFKDAEERFAEKCLEQDPRDGEVFSKAVKFIEYEYDDFAEMDIKDTVMDDVIYAHRRSDREEHSTMHTGIGGSL